MNNFVIGDQHFMLGRSLLMGFVINM